MKTLYDLKRISVNSNSCYLEVDQFSYPFGGANDQDGLSADPFSFITLLGEVKGYPHAAFWRGVGVATESLLRRVFGSEFQTAGAEHRKARFANVVVVKG